MDYNKYCTDLVQDVNDAVGAAVVDLSSGLLLGAYHTIAYFTQSYLDAVAAAAVDMFRGKNVSRIEQLISKQRGDSQPVRTIDEIQMTTIATYHFMKVVPGKDVLVVLITRKTTNMGMGWSSVRIAVENLSK